MPETSNIKSKENSLSQKTGRSPESKGLVQKTGADGEVLKNVQKDLDIIEEDERKELEKEKNKRKIMKQGQSFVQQLTTLSETEDRNEKWLRLDQRLLKLYYLIDKQSSADAMQLCTRRFVEWEEQISKQSAVDIPRFVQEQIDREQKMNDAIRPYMLERLQKSMRYFVKSGKYSDLREQLEKLENNGEYFLVSKNKEGTSERWKMEQHGNSAPLLYFRSTDPQKPGCVFSIDLIDFLDVIDKNPEKIGETANVALETYRQEHSAEQADALNNYDLPSDRNIFHLRVFPKTYNIVSHKGLHTSMFLSNTLKQRYKDSMTIRPPIFSDDPEVSLRQEIKTLFEGNKGKPIHLCIDIFSHGQKGHFSFEKPLEAKHLVQIAKEFPQCSFTYNTIACYGAGMMQGMSNEKSFASDPNLQSRLAVFTQTKGDAVNVTAASDAVTIYYMHLMQALNEGKSYGEAARRADLEVKAYLPIDAEALINGRKLVMGKPANSDGDLSA